MFTKNQNWSQATPIQRRKKYFLSSTKNSCGHEDFAISSSAVNVFLGNGDGTFAHAGSYEAESYQLASGDLNGDGGRSNPCWA